MMSGYVSLTSGCLHLAVLAGKESKVKKLLSRGEDVNEVDSFNRTALHLACESPHDKAEEIIYSLLKNKANVNAQTSWGVTPLHVASECRHGDAEAVFHALFECGADVNVRTKWGATPLHLACLRGNRCAVDALLSSGARVNVVDSECMTALHVLAMSKETDPSLTVTLLNHKASVTAVDSRRRTPLHYFSSRPGKATSVIEVLKRGGNVNARDAEGNTPLHLACKFNLGEVVGLLIRFGADVKAQNCTKSTDGNCTTLDKTALHLAAGRCSDGAVGVLVRSGVDVNARDASGDTPLHLACSIRYNILDRINTFRRLRCVEILLQNGASLDVKNDRYRTVCDEAYTAAQILEKNVDVCAHYEFTKRLAILEAFENHLSGGARSLSRPSRSSSCDPVRPRTTTSSPAQPRSTTSSPVQSRTTTYSPAQPRATTYSPAQPRGFNSSHQYKEQMSGGVVVHITGNRMQISINRTHMNFQLTSKNGRQNSRVEVYNSTGVIRYQN